MTQRRKRKQRIGVCVYCGKKKNLTSDHIPPKNLFAIPRPNSLITVPCCQPCNATASLDDEYFRLVLVSRWDTIAHPEAQAVWPAAMRSLKKPQKRRFKDAFLRVVHNVDVHSPAGIYLGTRGMYDVDIERLNKVICRIVAGIFYHHHSRRVPDTFTISSFYMDVLDLYATDSYRLFTDIVQALIQRQPNVIGRDVFAYWYQHLDDNVTSSAWLLRFYGKVYWVSIIFPRAEVGLKK